MNHEDAERYLIPKLQDTLTAYRAEIRAELAEEIYQLHLNAGHDEWWGLLLAAEHLQPGMIKRQQRELRESQQAGKE